MSRLPTTEWAENDIESREHLPVLLRKLVNSTGHDLRHVDFPGYDNAERKGSDGLTQADSATPWIPAGKSYWEFGTTADPRAKAQKDYAARLASVPASERANSTFIFVTPRNWPGKMEWAKQKNATGDWKTVRAYDASDLEQWLEESIPAQIWLAEKLGLPTRGFETLGHSTMLLDSIRIVVREEITAATGTGTHNDIDRLLTADEAAAILGVNVRWLYRHAAKLPFTRRISRKNLRFSEAGLGRWIAAKKPAPR